MGKLILFICIAVLIGSVISASTSNREEAPACKRQGDPCQVSEECCPDLWCLTYAAKCVTKGGLKSGEEPEVILVKSTKSD